MIHPRFNLSRASYIQKNYFPHPPAPFPLGRGMNSENKDEAVHLHRFILVFGFFPSPVSGEGQG
jgi:hypothetical protein